MKFNKLTILFEDKFFRKKVGNLALKISRMRHVSLVCGAEAVSQYRIFIRSPGVQCT